MDEYEHGILNRPFASIDVEGLENLLIMHSGQVKGAWAWKIGICNGMVESKSISLNWTWYVSCSPFWITML